MDELIKLLDKNLDYIQHEIMRDVISIYVASNRAEAACPYYGYKSRRVHSTYGTIMVDIDTHRIIDMLDSREINDVAAWLKTYPNLKIVSRDGPVSYNSAIKKGGEDLIQVSDRFHLLKGLTDAAKKHITSIIAANIGLPVSSSHYEGIRTNDYWEKEVPNDFPARKHNVNYEKKVKIVEQVRKHKKGCRSQ